MPDVQQTPPSIVPTPPAPLKRRGRVGVWISWIAIVACLVLVNWNTLRSHKSKYARDRGDAGADPQTRVASQYAVGIPRLLQFLGAGTESRQMSGDLIAQAVDNARTPADKLRVAAVLGELNGAQAARQQIQAARAAAGPLAPDSPLAQDADRFDTIYAGQADALSVEAREELMRRHDWFARLAFSFGKPDSDTARTQALNSAALTAGVLLTATFTALGLGAIGLILLILAIVKVAQRRVRLAYSSPEEGAENVVVASNLPAFQAPPPPTAPPGPPPPLLPYRSAPPPGWVHYSGPPIPRSPAAPHCPLRLGRLSEDDRGTAPYLEGFAIYIVGYIGTGELIAMFVRQPKIWMNFIGLLPVALGVLWPVIRGIRWNVARRSIGLHTGKGLFREIGCGMLGSIAGLPILGLAVLITAGVSKLTGQPPAQHPIKDLIGQGFFITLLLYILACVWAPITEETLFRGVLFHHLRHRLNWFLAAPLVALIFAGVHPYGYSGIPVLTALAVNFAAVREWRGSLVAPMTMHFIQNFLALTAMSVMMS